MGYTFQGAKQIIGTGNVETYLVDSESDLASIPTDIAPGSVAYTKTMEDMWMKGNDGTWGRIGGDS